MKKISFIGFGNLAQAMAQALVPHTDYQIYAAAPSLKQGINKLGIHTESDNLVAIQEAELIILAVKPNNLPAVLTEIGPKLPQDCLLLSLVSGLNLAWLERYTPSHQAIVRGMPNIALSVKQGATPLIANVFVRPSHKQQVEQLLQPCSLITWLQDETDIDRFTALSGSGPAYVFLFAEAMIEAAQKLGLNAELAKRFSLQTLLGATTLACQSGVDIPSLRKKVTSPAGTTAAAIEVFQHQGLSELVYQAMHAAYERAQELGRMNTNEI